MPQGISSDLIGVIRGPRNKKKKGIVEQEAESGEENDNKEMKTVP